MDILGAGLRGFLEKNPGTVKPFRQRFPWIGPDLQTLKNSFSNQPAALPIHKRLLAPIVPEGQSLSVSATYPAADDDCGRALLLIHGLGGDENSHYIMAAVQYFLDKGWSVYRMNYRGVGPSKETSVAPYSAGLSDDLRSVLNVVAGDAEGKQLFAVGFSLGGQLLMRTLGEGNVTTALCAAATVSAPLNLSNTLKKLQRPRNGIYVRYLVQNMMRDLSDVGQHRFGVDCSKLTSVWAFDEYIIAPAFGFRDAEDYYENVSCSPVLNDISIPLLAIHSKDDPWIPWEDYIQADWPDNKNAGAILLNGGGHVGFHCANSRGVWTHGNILNFFEKI